MSTTTSYGQDRIEGDVHVQDSGFTEAGADVRDAISRPDDDDPSGMTQSELNKLSTSANREAVESSTGDGLQEAVPAGRVAVMVVGMHRSGTSAMAGALARLGLGTPATPVPPNFDNPMGFYESAVIVELNDRILKAAGSSYDDWRRIDPGSLASADVGSFVTEAGQRYLQEYSASNLAVFKDPRVCRLISIWREAFAQIKVEARIVFVYRPPLDVAKSLQKRNGFPLSNGVLLWLRHVLDAERETRDFPRCFISFDTFLNDWREAARQVQERLHLDWPRAFSAAEADIDAYLSKELHHHTSTTTETSKIHFWAVEVYQALNALARDPDGAEPRTLLDRIGSQFDVACDLFSITAIAGYKWAEKLSAERAILVAKLDEMEELRASSVEQLMDFTERNKDNILALNEERDQARAASEQHASIMASLKAELKNEQTSAQKLRSMLAPQNVELAIQKSIAEGLLESPVWQLTAPIRIAKSIFRSILYRCNKSAANPHFDQSWYLDQYPDINKLGLDPYRHYLDHGARERRNPSAMFSTEWYLERYPDVRESGVNPLVHFWHCGQAEGRLPHPEALNPFFDTAWYAAQYGDGYGIGIEPYNHYLRFGADAGLDPSPDFNTLAYLKAHPDVQQDGMNPLVHYWKYGKDEGRTIESSALSRRSDGDDTAMAAADFNATWYLSRYPDVRRANLDPWEHFLKHGEAEGRRPNPFFDPDFYRGVYTDVRAAGVSPFQHYRDAGLREGRLPREVAHRAHVGARRILFIGHDAYAAGSQRVLLEIVGWFRRHTLYDISILLLGPGHLTTDYARLARTFVVAGDVADEIEAIRRFIGSSPEVIYCNTVVTGRALVQGLLDVFANSIVIAHCHELANIIATFQEPFKALSKHANYWICASPATTALLRSNDLLKGRRIETVQAFIKPSTLSVHEKIALRRQERVNLGVPLDALVVLGCGTLHWRKDPVLFAETAIELLATRNRPDVYFVWIGSGEDEPAIEEMVKNAGLSDRILTIGYRANASDLLCLGDVFFLSSIEDPFPLVVLEAGQFGIPAVCFEGATGMSDLIAEGGCVVADRRPETASAALLTLLRDESTRTRLGHVLRREVERRYTVDVQLPRILTNLYEAGVKPAVSIIVPNYNHELFLKARLLSLFSQNVKDFELLVLDDASQDASLKVIEPFTSDPRTRLVVNVENSGSAFVQWQRGVDLARSDVIWIAESDDSCEPDFLSLLLPHMLRSDVRLAFGRTEIIDTTGALVPGALQPYLDRMAPGFGIKAFGRSGSSFVNDGFGAICSIVNASGVLMRRGPLKRALPAANTFKMCGDWRVYLQIMGDGSIHYEPLAVNYFRRHSGSTVHKLEGTNLYFKERLRIAAFVSKRFRTTSTLRARMETELQHEACRFSGRYDADLDLSLKPIFAVSDAPDFLAEQVHACFYVHGMLFSKGGIERLFSMISALLVDRGFKISLACAPESDAPGPVFSLRPEVEITTVDIRAPSGVAALRRFLQTREVDVFVPMLSEELFENAFAAAEGLGIPIVASEHNNPTIIEERWWSREGRLACFTKAAAIHLVSDLFRPSLPQDLQGKLTVIPHPVGLEFTRARWHPSEPQTIVAVGRLARQKRFDLLIRAFAFLADEFPDWRLVIYGEGAERAHLTRMVEALDLTERVQLPGTTTRIAEDLERASLFAMSSEFEATGLALLEALAVGVPVVAFAACEGNDSIIRDRETGRLAQDFTAASLANAMRDMMSDRALRERCSHAGRKVVDAFTLDRAAKLWEKLILDLADKRSSAAPVMRSEALAAKLDPRSTATA